MEYIKATASEAEQIFELVQETIKTVYPKYYPQEVVDFFCEHHRIENVRKDIESGAVGILIVENKMVGTGSCIDNHITRVFVAPAFQGQGYGSYIMQCLENHINTEYDVAYLDASLPASHLYETRGYKTIRHDKWVVENGVVLVYEIMEKQLTAVTTAINT